jgi:hypothetical protein
MREIERQAGRNCQLISVGTENDFKSNATTGVFSPEQHWTVPCKTPEVPVIAP